MRLLWIVYEEYNGMKVSDALIMIRKNKQNIDFTAIFKTGLSVRMVAFYSKEKNETVLLVTIINHEILAPKLVTNAYRVRDGSANCASKISKAEAA